MSKSRTPSSSSPDIRVFNCDAKAVSALITDDLRGRFLDTDADDASESSLLITMMPKLTELLPRF